MAAPRYDAAGNETWTRQFGTIDSEQAYGVATHSSGIYVAGETGGALGTPIGNADYFLRKYDPSGAWLPADAESEAKVAEWMSKSANEVHQGPWMKRAKVRRPDAIKLSNEEIDARCDHILKLMDAWLAKRDWLALGRPTIADISCFGPISMLKVSGYDTDKWPNVTRWLERFKALPGAHDIDGNPFKT